MFKTCFSRVKVQNEFCLVFLSCKHTQYQYCMFAVCKNMLRNNTALLHGTPGISSKCQPGSGTHVNTYIYMCVCKVRVRVCVEKTDMHANMHSAVRTQTETHETHKEIHKITNYNDIFFPKPIQR